jgi:hypothetical protein
MKNYNADVIQEIEKKSIKLYESFVQADQWSSENLKFEEQDNLSLKIKRNRAEISKIQSTIPSKPVFAIFGISQVGKSYLVQNILSQNGEALKVQVGEHELDFLSSINPAGNNAESTGVVTRFSIDASEGDNDFPIKAKLLTAKDAIIILADAFFSDITKLESYTSKEEFKEKIQQIRTKYDGQPVIQPFLTEDDIWNTAKYFKQNFNKYAQNVKEIEISGFWMDLGKIINRVPPQEWHSIFELIWCRDKELTRLFQILISALESIKFAPKIFLNEHAVLRTKGAVLDVQRLDGMLGHSDTYQVKLPSNEVLSIEISKLSALIAEITLNVDPKIAENKTFLNNTDLLDFPGARSREEFTTDMIQELIAVKMFLRGKVSFLFNKYSSDFEINNLLFCLKDEKIEVNIIADLLYDWIIKNIGEDDEKREKTLQGLPISPLFVIMTFFNRQLALDPVNDHQDVSYKWDNRFRRFFEEQITLKYGWHTKWTKSKPNFSNFFFLRDFKYSTDTFQSENGIEVGIREERKGHMVNLKNSFLANPFVQKHFENPEKTWEYSASPRMDGSQIIIDALTPAANNFVKINNFTETLDLFRVDLKDALEKHHIADSIDEKRAIAFRKATEIEFELLQLFSHASFKFTDFLKALSLSDSEVYNILHENFLSSQKRQEPEHFQIFKQMFPSISIENTRETNLQIICDQLKLDSIEATEAYLRSKDIDLDTALENRVLTSASKLVDAILDHWKKRLDIEGFQNYFDMGLEKNAMVSLIENLLETFQTLDIRNELIELFEHKTRLISAPSDTEEYLAAIITEFINDFISNFGFNFMKEERIQEVMKIAHEYNQDLSLITREGKENKSAVLLDIYDKMETRDAVAPPLIENFQLFILKLKLAMLSNCGFANYNIASNNQLNEMIQQLESFNFHLSE